MVKNFKDKRYKLAKLVCVLSRESWFLSPSPLHPQTLPAITVSSLVVILLGQDARARVLTVPSMLGFGGDVLVLMGLWNQHFIIGGEHSI